MRINRTWVAAAVMVPAALLTVTGCKGFTFDVSHAGHTATCTVNPDTTQGACDGFTVSPGKSSPSPHRTPVPTVSSNPAPSTQCQDPDHDNDCDNNTDVHGHK